MFKINNLVPIAGIASTIVPQATVVPMSALEGAIYRELTMEEKPSIEHLFDFYQKDAHHEFLMESISTDLARAVNGVISKVQNELLDLVDNTYEEVQRATRDMSNEIITHKLTLVSPIDFLETSHSQEIDGINVDNMSRMAHNRATGTKFPQRTSNELLQRIRKTMSDDTFGKFVSMVTTLDIDVEAIYNVVIRSAETKLTPLTMVTPMEIGYSYIEAVVGYHIAKSLMVTADDEARLTEEAYGEYVSIMVNNLTVRYGRATNAIDLALKASATKARYTVEDGVINLSVYKPTIDAITADKEVSYDAAIKSILNSCVTGAFGSVVNTDPSERYDIYRRELMNKNNLNMSSSKVKQTLISLEKFVNSRHFIDWFTANNDGEPTMADKTNLLDKCRPILTSASVATDDELYTLIINVVCEAFYDRPGIKRFVTDIRTCIMSYDVSIHEAIGLASDRLVMSYLVGMVKV